MRSAPKWTVLTASASGSRLCDGRIQAAVVEGALAYEPKSRRPQLGEAGWGVYLARALGHRWGSWHDAERGCVLVQMGLSGSGP